MKATMFPSQLLVPALLVGVASIAAGCVPRSGETTSEMTTVLTDSDSDSMGTTDDTAPTTLGTTTSTVTTEPPTTGEVSSTTGSDTDTSTTGDTDASTTEEPVCNYDGTCDADENATECLHDCGGCEPDGVCDGAFENPYACPSDCPATDCDADDSVDALAEQCDDGNDVNEDACTATCDLNVCGDFNLGGRNDSIFPYLFGHHRNSGNGQRIRSCSNNAVDCGQQTSSCHPCCGFIVI